MNWLKLRQVVIDHALEIYVGSIAVIFTGLGIWHSRKLMRPKVRTVVVRRMLNKN